MASLLQKFWADDQGAIISVEWILIVSVLIFGLIPGLVALRNTIDAAYATIGNLLMSLVPNFTFSGFIITDSGGSNIAEVGGYSFSGTPTYLISSQDVPNVITGVIVDPAP